MTLDEAIQAAQKAANRLGQTMHVYTLTPIEEGEENAVYRYASTNWIDGMMHTPETITIRPEIPS